MIGAEAPKFQRSSRVAANLNKIFEIRETKSRSQSRAIDVNGAQLVLGVTPIIPGWWNDRNGKFFAYTLLRTDSSHEKSLLIASRICTDFDGNPVQLDEPTSVGRALVPAILTGEEFDSDVVQVLKEHEYDREVISYIVAVIATRGSRIDPFSNANAKAHLQKIIAKGTSLGAEVIDSAVSSLNFDSI
jgi:hypothetical protein